MSFGSLLTALEERVGELVAVNVSVFRGSDAGALLERLAVIEAQLVTPMVCEARRGSVVSNARAGSERPLPKGLLGVSLVVPK